MKKILMTGAALTFLAVMPAMADHHGGGKMMKVDSNQDGVISKSEFLAAQEERFAKIDANNDGEITKDEMKAQRDAMKEKRQERRDSKSSE